LDVIDDSHKHSGHAAMKGLKPTESHFRIVIASGEFENLTLLQRHRKVNHLLKEELIEIHALQLVTKTPGEFAAE
jgi:stress-induced morphogen